MKRLICIAIIIGISVSAKTQILPDFDPNKAKVTTKYISSYFKDINGICTAPLHWNGSDWLKLTALSAGTSILLTQDKKIHNWFQEKRTVQSNRFVTNFIEPWGGKLRTNYTVYSVIGFYGAGLILKSERIKKTAMLAGKSFILTALFTGVSKALIGRHRPYQTIPSDPFVWEGPNLNGFYSLPSGHTSTVFAVASVFAHEYRNKWWVGATAYSLATAVGISRIHDNKHWPSDVLLGASLGWVIGKYIVNKNSWGINISSVNGDLITGVQFKF